LNVQIERLENHTARLTAEVDPDRLEKAKQKAARQIAGKVNIPGFRKGKAPYRILVNYVGEASILEDAFELLGDEIYPEVIDASGVDPYGKGEIENISIESTPPTIQFRVALFPEVDLKDYRSVRVEYALPEIDEETFNRALKALQEQYAVVEESHQPLARGNRANFDFIYGFVPKAEAEGDEDHGHDHIHEHDYEEFIHEHNFPMLLDGDVEPLPGFIDAVIGMNPGESRKFSLTAPDDAEKYGDFAGKTIRFDVSLAKIEVVTLPTLNDDFAARVTANLEKPMTLLDLRLDLRDKLQKTNEERYKSQYTMEAVDAIRAQAEIHYPEAVVIDQINMFLKDLDRQLRQQGLTLKDYLRLNNLTLEQVAEDFRPSAVRTLERGLILREVGVQEGIELSDDLIDAEIGRIVETYDEDRRESLRDMFGLSKMRLSIANDLLIRTLYDRIIAIAKGDDLPPVVKSQPAEADQKKGETV
jgi:trigger factor